MIPELLKAGAIIVDVRSEAEFQSSHNPNSINIPLDRLNSDFHKIDKNKKVILCCASGSRSGIGLRILRSKGFEVYNGGSWRQTL